jgi:putative NADH-flavin reductase
LSAKSFLSVQPEWKLALWRSKMKVAHIGATGKVGGKILEELLRRGHRVTAISRHPEKALANSNVAAAGGDITEPEQLAALVKGHDAVISSAPFLPGSSHKLLDAIHKSGVTRYIAVGGAGSLEIAPGKLLKDSGEIPAEWLPAINEGAALLGLLRADNHLDWTFFSPAAVIGPGARTGQDLFLPGCRYWARRAHRTIPSGRRPIDHGKGR